MASASSPLAADPITSSPACALSIFVRPEQTTGWSSTIRIRIRLLCCFDMRDTLRYIHPFALEQGGQIEARRDWGGHLDAGTLARLTKDFQLRINRGCALSHATQPEPEQAAAFYEPNPVVTNCQPYNILLPTQGNLQATRIGMANSIGDTLLADTQQGIGDPRGERPRAAAAESLYLDRSAFHHLACRFLQRR